MSLENPLPKGAGFLFGGSLFDLSFRADIKNLEKSLNALAYKQLPFATSKALTAIAKHVAEAEVKNMSAKLDNPAPFTLKSVGTQGARKDNLEAIVYLRDIAAGYLKPYEFGGVNKLNGKALLRPANIRLNQYGNLSKTKIAQLKARKDVFIGIVKTKHGEINGVWQRPYHRANTKMRGQSRKMGLISGLSNTTGHLKLLIRFEDAHEVKQHLGWRALAKKVASANFNRELGKALAAAIATAK